MAVRDDGGVVSWELAAGIGMIQTTVSLYWQQRII
jgi:hypothetical protein